MTKKRLRQRGEKTIMAENQSASGSAAWVDRKNGLSAGVQGRGEHFQAVEPNPFISWIMMLAQHTHNTIVDQAEKHQCLAPTWEASVSRTKLKSIGDDEAAGAPVQG